MICKTMSTRVLEKALYRLSLVADVMFFLTGSSSVPVFLLQLLCWTRSWFFSDQRGWAPDAWRFVLMTPKVFVVVRERARLSLVALALWCCPLDRVISSLFARPNFSPPSSTVYFVVAWSIAVSLSRILAPVKPSAQQLQPTMRSDLGISRH